MTSVEANTVHSAKLFRAIAEELKEPSTPTSEERVPVLQRAVRNVAKEDGFDTVAAFEGLHDYAKSAEASAIATELNVSPAAVLDLLSNISIQVTEQAKRTTFARAPKVSDEDAAPIRRSREEWQVVQTRFDAERVAMGPFLQLAIPMKGKKVGAEQLMETARRIESEPLLKAIVDRPKGARSQDAVADTFAAIDQQNGNTLTESFAARVLAGLVLRGTPEHALCKDIAKGTSFSASTLLKVASFMGKVGIDCRPAARGDDHRRRDARPALGREEPGHSLDPPRLSAPEHESVLLDVQ